jgi:hypothetical protein
MGMCLQLTPPPLPHTHTHTCTTLHYTTLYQTQTPTTTIIITPPRLAGDFSNPKGNNAATIGIVILMVCCSDKDHCLVAPPPPLPLFLVLFDNPLATFDCAPVMRFALRSSGSLSSCHRVCTSPLFLALPSHSHRHDTICPPFPSRHRFNACCQLLLFAVMAWVGVSRYQLYRLRHKPEDLSTLQNSMLEYGIGTTLNVMPSQVRLPPPHSPTHIHTYTCTFTRAVHRPVVASRNDGMSCPHHTARVHCHRFIILSRHCFATTAWLHSPAQHAVRGQ